MSRAPKAPRRDAWHRALPPGDPRRAQIAAWHLADGEQSCRQRMLSELGICSPGEPGKPVGHSSFYDGINFWRAEDSFLRMQSTAAAQAELEAAERGLTIAQREELTDRHFISLAAAAENTDVYLELRKLRIADESAKTKGRHDAAKLATANRRAAQAERSLLVLEAKFRRETCALFLQWSAEEKARAIIGSTGTNAEKIEQLGLAMFGEDWKA